MEVILLKIVKVTFLRNSIPEFPMQVPFGNFIPGRLVERNVYFTTPPNVNYQDTIHIYLQIEGENCYQIMQKIQLKIDGRRAVLSGIELTHISFRDPWDCCISNPSDFTCQDAKPDIYYRILDSQNRVVNRSRPFLNSLPQSSRIYWSFTPGIDIETNETYTIDFLDHDTGDSCSTQEYEFIGSVKFKPSDCISSPLLYCDLQGGQTEAKIYLNWED